MKVYILYTCDTWHTPASKQIISVCSKLDIAVNIADRYSKRENGIYLSDEDKMNLYHIKQTQGYDKEEKGRWNISEFLIEEYETNTII